MSNLSKQFGKPSCPYIIQYLDSGHYSLQ